MARWEAAAGSQAGEDTSRDAEMERRRIPVIFCRYKEGSESSEKDEARMIIGSWWWGTGVGLGAGGRDEESCLSSHYKVPRR